MQSNSLFRIILVFSSTCKNIFVNLSKLFLFSGNLISESKEEEEVLLPHLHKRSEEEAKKKKRP
jgi:hypothetical protein